jgi:ATP-dependent Clp endopeptidase proteolytic subunit ClpP
MSKKWLVCSEEEAETTEVETVEQKEVNVVDNNIYFYTEVSPKSIKELLVHIKEITKKNQIIGITFGIDTPPINIYINSEGGCLYSALSIIDIISLNKVTINTIVSGVCMSAATLILLSGHNRCMMVNSYMLIHNISSGFWGKMHEFEDEMKNLNELTKKLKEIYKKNSNITKTQLDKILKTDVLIPANDCLKYGLIDEIKEN